LAAADAMLPVSTPARTGTAAHLSADILGWHLLGPRGRRPPRGVGLADRGL
jgi:hypothetical protein